MLEKSIILARKYYKDLMRRDKEPVFNHAKRIAERAMISDYDERIISICYLHDILPLNLDIYHDVYEDIASIDKRLADVCDKFAIRKHESFESYFYRIFMCPEAKIVKMLEILDELPDTTGEEKKVFLDALARLSS